MSRKEFLGAIGGLALSAVLYKLGSAKDMLVALNPEKKTALASEPGTYGNHVYGGKRG